MNLRIDCVGNEIQQVDRGMVSVEFSKKGACPEPERFTIPLARKSLAHNGKVLGRGCGTTFAQDGPRHHLRSRMLQGTGKPVEPRTRCSLDEKHYGEIGHDMTAAFLG